MHYKKVIKEWAKLRHYDEQGVYEAAISLYNHSTPIEKGAMMLEFQTYINGVKSGKIEPSPVKLHIPKYKEHKNE